MKCLIDHGFTPGEIGFFIPAPAERSPVRLQPGQQYKRITYQQAQQCLGQHCDVDFEAGTISRINEGKPAGLNLSLLSARL